MKITTILFPENEGRSRACLMQGIGFVVVGALLTLYNTIPGIAVMSFGAMYTFRAQMVYMKEAP